MPGRLQDQHLTTLELVDYAEKKLTQERERTVEEHLNWCIKCVAWARKVMAVRAGLMGYSLEHRLVSRRQKGANSMVYTHI
jgi:hypothetical protein